LQEIYSYIAFSLLAKTAAEELMLLIENVIMGLQIFPYIYQKMHIYGEERVYRRIVVHNYIILYTINEQYKEVHVIHIVYKRKNYLNIN